MSSTGKLFLLLGPSGSGKGTILAYLREKYPDFVFPVSCTTREMRPNERPGEVYNFISEDEFEERKEQGEFLEWAHIHNHHYSGTLKAAILGPLEEGKTVIREVDVQGLKSIRDILPQNQLISIFLTVPAWDMLKKRILERSAMSDEELAERKKSFDIEMGWAEECDHVVESIEGDPDAGCKAVEQILLKYLDA